MHIRAILNQDGGTLRTMDMTTLCESAERAFSDAGHTLECRVIKGSEVSDALRAAASDDAVEAILAGGGDGTISAAATAAFRSGKPLAVLPAGTMNLFARALGIPPDLNQALDAIARGNVDHIDIATANGTPFVHQFGVGIHARLVRIRNDMVYHSRVGKMLASLRAIMAAALNPPQFRVQLETPKGMITRTVSGIAVSNNPLDNGAVPVAETLDAGVLGVYLADKVTTRELLGLAFDVFTGRWRDNELVSEAEVPELTLHFPHKKSSAHAVIDGELIKLDRDVELRIHRLGLKVIRPAPPVMESGTNFLE
jgi:diacylglycerol kinase family enzyme